MPGLLLRLTTHTGEKHFSSAATTLDPVGTAGHLVSMVMADGVINAPTALLANHMQSSLAAAVAKEGSDSFLIHFRAETSLQMLYCNGWMSVSPLLKYFLCSLDLSQAEEDVSCYNRVAKFLLACLTRIPTKTCQALLQQVSHTALTVSDYRIKSYSLCYSWREVISVFHRFVEDTNWLEPLRSSTKKTLYFYNNFALLKSIVCV